ncbi:hypothetical protein FHS34_001977 [Streptomyces echinatus]|uniref:Uncharacterized protein n=1 Tax=Streptomyces echinatus TaxID=67293 RepID=A0A7W9UQ35_9ACTN|nr:hypothetical protein [Streptomyces echinatus]
MADPVTLARDNVDILLTAHHILSEAGGWLRPDGTAS